MTSAIVVGKDEWVRRGLADALREAGGWDVRTAGLDAGRPPGHPPDVVLVDPFDPTAWDRWRGLDVVGWWPTGEVDVVIASNASVNPLVRLRLAQAGVVDVIAPGRLVGAASLVDAVEEARRRRLAVPTADDLARVGSRPGGRPGACLDLVAQRGIEQAFSPGIELRDTGLSRRGAMRVRSDVARLGRLRTSPRRATGGPHRDLSLPTWREVVAYVNRARGLSTS